MTKQEEWEAIVSELSRPPADKHYVSADEEAAKHWEYVRGILEAHGIQASIRDSVGYHYQTAFVHGWKHGQEIMK
jgi:hypothetical protein